MTLNKAKGRMFVSVGWTWNPIAGCTHGCPYCWAKSLMKRWGKTFEPQFREHFFKDKMPDDGSWIFVGSMGDTFCEGVPDEWILRLLKFIKECEADNVFLLQTKNPVRFMNFLPELLEIKDKVVIGTTLESTLETPWTSAPAPGFRNLAVRSLKGIGFKTFLSLEPIADFGYETMKLMIMDIQPEAVEIGRENYTSYLPEVSDSKLLMLIDFLESEGITYVLKANLQHLQSLATTTREIE